MDELRGLVRLAIPVVGVQLGLRAMSTVDTMMVGQVSEVAMAAVSVGNAWVWMVTVFGLGLVSGTEPMFAQAFGARDDAATSRTMLRGLVWALVLTAPTMLAIHAVEGVLRMSGQPESVIPRAASYARIVSLGTLPLLGFGVLRLALQAATRLRPLLFAIVLANVFNVFANWVLVFGHLGFPALGSDGTAWATATSRLLLFGLLLATSWPVCGRHVLAFRNVATRRRALQGRGLLRVAAVGAPIGLQVALEMGVFAATTLTIGSLGEVPVAGHQIALDVASLTFMVPLGLGSAAAVRVGHAVGRGDGGRGVRIAGALALAVSVGVGLVFALTLFVAPALLARAYTHADAVVALAASLLPIAALFQVFDGLQAVAAGVLRGLGRTFVPMLVNLVGFWGVGFPLGLYLCFARDQGAAGMWQGFVAGLGAVALGLLALVFRHFRRVHERLAID